MLFLSAEGVQIGTRFAVCQESSAHEAFKTMVHQAQEGDTMLVLKQLAPTRLLKNKFYNEVVSAEQQCATAEMLTTLLGRGRAKEGMFNGDLEEGELEIGQIASMVHKDENVEEIFSDIISDFNATISRISTLRFD